MTWMWPIPLWRNSFRQLCQEIWFLPRNIGLSSLPANITILSLWPPTPPPSHRITAGRLAIAVSHRLHYHFDNDNYHRSHYTMTIHFHIFYLIFLCVGEFVIIVPKLKTTYLYIREFFFLQWETSYVLTNETSTSNNSKSVMLNSNVLS